ncbi:MAG: cell division topological specificity factor MinE [Fusobacteria bacterium]|jgi:cell division topological specificity factor|nr:cell division topological specificity factor MinE [Fusobacteriota bacterium]
MLKNIFDKLFKKEEVSSSIAKNRLKVVITQDRTSFSPKILGLLKDDLMEVFSRYFELEKEDIHSIKLENEEDNLGLSISIPIKKVKINVSEGNEK